MDDIFTNSKWCDLHHFTMCIVLTNYWGKEGMFYRLGNVTSLILPKMALVPV